MKKIELYIGGKLVDLDEEVDIVINKQLNDIFDPSKLKNDFSKTISLPSTKSNDEIFGKIFSVNKTIEYEPLLPPQIIITGTPVDKIEHIYDVKNYTISGIRLTSDIIINAPTNFKISLDQNTWTNTITLNQSLGIVNETIIYIMLDTTTIGLYSGTITNVTNGDSEDVSINGEVYSAILTLNGLPLTKVEHIYDYKTYTIEGIYLIDDVIITAPSGFSISLDGTGYTSGITLNQTLGVLNTTTIYSKLNTTTIGIYDGFITNVTTGDSEDVYIIGEVYTPILISGGTLTEFTKKTYESGITQTYTISATYLINDLIITAPINWEISLDNNNFYSGTSLTSTLGTINSTNIYIRMSGETIGNYSGYTNHSTSGATLDIYISGKITDDRFITEWLMTSGSFTLPTGNIDIYNCTIDWGDGYSNIVTTYNDTGLTHTYASGGTYQIKIKGIYRWLSINNGTQKSKIRKVLNWGNVGFLSFYNAFYGCNNLSILPSGAIPDISGITTNGFNTTFYGCSSLTNIPSNIFDNAINLSNNGFYQTFYGCNKITTIPTDLFRYNTKVSDFNSTFYSCTILESIPVDLFRYNSGITNSAFQNTFTSCKALTSLPTDLFRYNTEVASNGFNGTFYGCSSLTSIPTDLFRYNTKVSSNGFQNTFRTCTSLVSGVTSDLFRYNTEVSSNGFNSTFYGCSSLTSIPTDLFRYNINVSTSGFYQTFMYCNKLTSIPVDLFRYNTVVSTNGFQQTFTNCTKLTSIPTDLFRYNTQVSTYGFYETFYGCSSLVSGVTSDLFRYCPNVSTAGFYQTFYGCQSLTSIPTDLFKYNTLVSTYGFNSTFAGCSSLTSIPVDLFRYNTQVSTYGFYQTFYNCTSLTTIESGITFSGNSLTTSGFYETFRGCNKLNNLPTDLFRYCPNVSSSGFYQTFYGCTALTSLPTDVFRYNIGLTTDAFYGTFNGCTGITSLPTDLFRYNTGITSNAFRETFFGCTILESVPDNLFKYNTLVNGLSFYSTFQNCNKLQINPWTFYADGEQSTRFSGITSLSFQNCFSRNTFTGVQGTAPDLWNCTFGATPTTTGCYGGTGNNTTSISNYASIPAGYK